MLSKFFRFWQQTPTTKPPSGYKDLRLNKSTGALVLVDADGTETVLAVTTTSAAGITSADITDATADGLTNKGKVLKSSAAGGLILGVLTADEVIGTKSTYNERSDPTPTSGAGTVYTRNTGGKTELVVVFGSGSPIQIAIEA